MTRCADNRGTAAGVFQKVSINEKRDQLYHAKYLIPRKLRFLNIPPLFSPLLQLDYM